MKKIFERIEPKSRREKRVIIIGFLLLIGLVLLDQVTKFATVKYFELHESKELINGLFAWVHVRNEGAAWGILAGRFWLLVAISATALTLFSVMFRQICEGCFERYMALALLFSGIIGNTFDRFYHGAVIDFLDFYLKIGDKVHHWPAFNVADMAICTGVGILLLSNMIRKDLNKKAEKIEE